MGFLNISGESEIQKFPVWGKYGEKYGEKQTFQSYGFLKHFG